MMELFLITLAVAVVSAMAMFKIYHLLLTAFLHKMDWSIDELKNYEVTPTVKMWDQILQVIVMIGIFYKVIFT